MSPVSRPLDSAGTALCGRTALGSASRPRSPKALPGGMFRMRLKGVWFRVGTETSAHRGNQFHRSDLGNAARGLHPASAKAGPFFGSPRVGDGADSDAQGWQAVMARLLVCTEHQNPAGLATAPAGFCFVGHS